MICRNSVPGGKYWRGNLCSEWTTVGETATAVLCSRCVQQVVDPPEYKTNYKSKGYPRGWQFRKEFVHEDGTVYHKGKEQSELKGTLTSTKIEKVDKKKLSKKEKQELKDALLQQMVFVRGQIKKAKWKKDLRANEVNLRKIERKLKKLN
jgi:hypothetical protein